VSTERAAPISLDFVVPCYNEEDALPETHRQLAAVRDTMFRQGRITTDSKICYVDDGSLDATWSLICALSVEHPWVFGIRLSRNFGHQSAVLAGLFTSAGDAVITIDADLQDDVAAIPAMLECYREGCEIVYGVRRERSSDTVFKRRSALFYYSLLRKLGVNVIRNHADYRLMSRRALHALSKFTEVNLFLRGLVPLIGFRSSNVYYDRKSRLAGESKYSLGKMLRLALDGITSLSAVPLRSVSVMGMCVFLLSLGMAAWVLWIRLFTTRAVPGWASSVIPIYFLGGIQLLCLGVLGEYVAKSYLEIKRRPRYLISETTAPWGSVNRTAAANEPDCVRS